MNLLDLPSTAEGVQFGDVVYPVHRDVLSEAHGDVILGVRPEDLELSEHGIAVTVEVTEVLGADAYVHGITRIGDSDLPMIARVDGRRPPEKGELVHFTPKQGHVHIFDSASGNRLGD
jgi:multiple sugar transport system ATP-binding protein